MEIKKPTFKMPERPVMNNVQAPNVNNSQKKEGPSFNPINSEHKRDTSPVVATNSKKKLWILIVSIIAGVILAVSSIILFALPTPKKPSNIFVNLTHNGSTFDFSMVDNERIEVDNEGKLSVSLLPGDKFNGEFSVTSSSVEGQNAGSVFVRFRMYAIIEDNYFGNVLHYTPDASNINNWYIAKDGFIYYNNLLHADETISINMLITLVGEYVTEDLMGSDIYITSSFEVLQASAYQSITEMWSTAPYGWRTIVTPIAEGELA